MATATSQPKGHVRGAKWQEAAGAGLVLPRASSGGIIPDIPLDSLVANLVARTEQVQYGQLRNGPAAQPMVSARSAPAGLGKSRKSPLVASSSGAFSAPGSRKDEDYLWETDPNGGWMSSFP